MGAPGGAAPDTSSEAPGGARPGATEPAPPRPLMIGDHDETVGARPIGRHSSRYWFVESVNVEPPDVAEARRSGLGIGHGP